MELIETIANDPEFYVEMDFRPGDLQLLNNSVILHSREAYDDYDEPERKRHLLRLWLSAHEFADVEDGLRGGSRSASRLRRAPRRHHDRPRPCEASERGSGRHRFAGRDRRGLRHRRATAVSGDVGLQLLENSIATGAGLVALILAIGPVSGAHFNPVVTLADRLLGGTSTRDAAAYMVAQVLGGCAGPSSPT